MHTNTRTADLFGKMDPPSTWGALVEHTRRGGLHDQWLTELTAIIHKASRNNRFRPISGTFECPHSGRVMRPVLESIERDVVAGGYRVRLLFVEDPYSTPLRVLPASTQAFLGAYRTNSRLRWELIERFDGIDWTTAQVEACGHVLSRIEREGGSFSQWDLDTLCQNYPPEVQLEIRRIVGRWRELRRTGCQTEAQRCGALDDALSRRDVDRLRPLIDECATLVDDFLRLSHPIMQQMTARS